MVKLIGALFIILATTWIGFEKSRNLTARPKQLRDMRMALQILEAEIMYGHAPLAEAVTKISKQVPDPIAKLFVRFSENLDCKQQTVSKAWNQSLEEVWRWTELLKKEKEILSQFGETLGRHDRESQQKQIQLAMVHLEREENQALTSQDKYEKMFKSLGFFSGLLIAILLM